MFYAFLNGTVNKTAESDFDVDLLALCLLLALFCEKWCFVEPSRGLEGHKKTRWPQRVEPTAAWRRCHQTGRGIFALCDITEVDFQKSVSGYWSKQNNQAMDRKHW